MRPKLDLRLPARLAALVLASCTVLTGVDKLAVDDDGAPIDLPDGRGGPGPREAGGDTSANDTGATEDSSADGGSDASAACNELGLVAYWRLDEGAGDIVRDCTANALDGKMEAGTWTTGKKGGAVAFAAGSKGFVGFGSPALLSKTGAFTVMAWVRQDASEAGVATQYIVGKTLTAGLTGWRLATELPAYSMSVSGDAGAETKGGTVVEGKWTHVAAVFIPGVAVELYVDGVRLVRDTNSKSAALVPSTAELRIGTRSDGTFPFAGAVDDVRIYERALSDVEIAARAQP